MALTDDRGRAVPLNKAVQRLMRVGGLHIGRFPPVDSLGYHLKTVFRELRTNCILDVGAHIGEYGEEVRDLDYEGRIVSFEPVPASYAQLTQLCARDPQWTAHNVALGAEDSTMEMNIFRGTVFNSFLPASSYASERFGNQAEIVRTERVAVRRLDGMLDECIAGIEKPSLFLKMDTQGWDLTVLRGLGSRINEISAIQTELPVKSLYEGMPNFPEAITQLSAMGFELTGIFPVARDMDHLRIIELDCVLCRQAKPV